MSNSYATGTVSGNNQIGGLTGYNGGIINNCFATGTASGSYYVGGLVGVNHGGTVSNCFATGTATIDGNSVVCLVGYNTGTVNDYCYYSNTGLNYNDVGKSTSYVNFTNLSFISGNSGLNWNGNNITTADDSNYIWKIIDGYTLPYFQWQDTPDPLAPFVETISPDNGINSTESSISFWINITGAGFNTTNPVVNLTMDSQDTITGIIDSNTNTTINATFDLTQAIEGDWSLYVTNPDGQTSTAKTFTVISIVIPSAPEGFTNTTGNFWVNHSWDADATGTTDSYNISIGETWDNSTTDNYYNHTGLSAHAWSNITVYAYNTTDSTLSEGIVDNVQIPNNDVTIHNVTDITVTEGETINFDVNSTDADDDTPVFDCNRSSLFTDFNKTTGEVSWITDMSDAGIYSVEFNVSDDYGSTDSEVITITVNDFVLATPALSNTTGNFYVNWSWNPVTNADSYNVSWNGTWYNGTTVTEINDSDMDYHATSEITVLAYNETYGVLSDSIVDSVTLANNPVSITNLDNINVDESELIEIDASYTDLDDDSITFSCNRTDLFSDFNTSTGEGSWQTNHTSSGTYSVNFSINDGHGSTDSQVVTVTVTNVPTTIYVGSSGHDYTTIQDAINDATDGDTIIVNDGTYNENVDVDKSVILRSENGSTKTAVTAKYSETSVFYISTDNVTINGFNVTGTTSITAGIYLYSSNNHTITNNDVSGNYYGIVLGSSQNNKLTNNKVNSNDMYGIALGGSNNNTLINNNISNTSNNHGIYLLGSDYNILTSNTVCGNDAYGIYLDTSSNNTLTSNTVSENNEYGIRLLSSSNNILTGNTASSNSVSGIYLANSSFNTLTENIASQNEYDAGSAAGFYILESDNNILVSNIANYNKDGNVAPLESSLDSVVSPQDGIASPGYSCGYYFDSSDNTTLTDNTAIGNDDYAFYSRSSTNSTVDKLEFTNSSMQMSFVTDTSETAVRGNETTFGAPAGKTNVNGYVDVANRYGVNMTIYYDDSGMSSSVEASIALFKLNGSEWVEVPNATLSTSGNYVSVEFDRPMPDFISIADYTSTYGLFKNVPSSDSSSDDDGVRASVSQGQDPAIVSNSASSVKRVTGGSPVDYDFSDSGTPVLGVSFDAKDDKGLVVAKVQVLSGSPEGVPASSGNSYRMMSIDVGSEGTVSSDNADNIHIRFKVSKQWIEENSIDVSTIRMTRYHGEQWNDLPTYQEKEDDDYIYFYAETPGFSIFEVVGDSVAADTVETSEVSAEFSEPVEEDVEMPAEDEGGFGYIYLILGIVAIGIVGYIVVKNQKGEGGL